MLCGLHHFCNSLVAVKRPLPQYSMLSFQMLLLKMKGIDLDYFTLLVLITDKYQSKCFSFRCLCLTLCRTHCTNCSSRNHGLFSMDLNMLRSICFDIRTFLSHCFCTRNTPSSCLSNTNFHIGPRRFIFGIHKRLVIRFQRALEARTETNHHPPSI